MILRRTFLLHSTRRFHRRQFQPPLSFGTQRCWSSSAAASAATAAAAAAASTSSSESVLLSDKYYDLTNPNCNVTQTIAQKIGRNLHLQMNHPLNILSKKIQQYFSTSEFEVYDDLPPITSLKQSFDSLRIPTDHVSRSMSDTYYLDSETVLRPHTSSHQVEILSASNAPNNFLVVGDVYRRDEIDRSHYPVFHQMEGVKMFDIFEDENIFQRGLTNEADQNRIIEHDLKSNLEGLAYYLFGDVKMRWVDEYFPFTEPSYELEIYYNNEWMEVLGCGVIHPDIIQNANRNPKNEKGWAFGLGLERLAMVLFQIPDIRLFWSDDDRFHSQFITQGGNKGIDDDNIIKFQTYSKYPPCMKDVSFWLPTTYENEESAETTNFHVNDMNELIRDVAGDIVEQVELIDNFQHPKTKRISHCYRIYYRHMDRNLTNEEIDDLQAKVRQNLVQQMNLELR